MWRDLSGAIGVAAVESGAEGRHWQVHDLDAIRSDLPAGPRAGGNQIVATLRHEISDSAQRDE
jgi:hypothetical protein